MWGSLAVISTILLQTLVHGLLRDTVSALSALQRASACQSCPDPDRLVALGCAPNLPLLAADSPLSSQFLMTCRAPWPLPVPTSSQALLFWALYFPPCYRSSRASPEGTVLSLLNALQHSLLYAVWAVCTSCRRPGEGPSVSTCGTALRAVK